MHVCDTVACLLRCDYYHSSACLKLDKKVQISCSSIRMIVQSVCALQALLLRGLRVQLYNMHNSFLLGTTTTVESTESYRD
jgi:hypothetical protein